MNESPPANLEDFPANAGPAPAPYAELPVQLNEQEKAMLLWAGTSLHYHTLRSCVERLLDNAQIHPPTQGKRNARLLVYEDRAQELRDMVLNPVQLHQEATEFWEAREQETEITAGLHRMATRLAGVVRRLEAQAGVKPLPNDGTPMDERIEQIATVLIDIVQAQARELTDLKARLLNRRRLVQQPAAAPAEEPA